MNIKCLNNAIESSGALVSLPLRNLLQKKKISLSLYIYICRERDVVVELSLSHVWIHRLQHARLLFSSLSPEVCTGPCPLSQWCHPTISFSAAPSPFAFNLSQHQSFTMSQLFSSGGESIGTSSSVLPMNIQCCFLLGLTVLIFLQSKGLSRV